MKEKKLTVNAAEGVSEIIIREGAAVEAREPRIINIAGVLSSPAEWLKSRKEQIDQKQCNVVVNREKMTVTLVIGETEYHNTTITGALELHEKFKEFGINTGEYMTNFEMAQLFKMNRTFFENRDVAMNLVTELQNFRAKVDKEIEKANNNRGDRRLLLAQTVESNLPEAFHLKVPIFKGEEKQTFEVEVYIRPDDFCCTLVSPEANDIVEQSRDQLIDKVVNEIRETCEGIVIIEQ